MDKGRDDRKKEEEINKFAAAMSAEMLKQFGVMDIGLKKQQCGHADAGGDL